MPPMVLALSVASRDTGQSNMSSSEGGSEVLPLSLKRRFVQPVLLDTWAVAVALGARSKGLRQVEAICNL